MLWLSHPAQRGCFISKIRVIESYGFSRYPESKNLESWHFCNTSISYIVSMGRFVYLPTNLYIYMYTHTMNRPMAPYVMGFFSFFSHPKNQPTDRDPINQRPNQDQRPASEYDQLRKFIEVRGPMVWTDYSSRFGILRIRGIGFFSPLFSWVICPQILGL